MGTESVGAQDGVLIEPALLPVVEMPVVADDGRSAEDEIAEPGPPMVVAVDDGAFPDEIVVGVVLELNLLEVGLNVPVGTGVAPDDPVTGTVPEAPPDSNSPQLLPAQEMP